MIIRRAAQYLQVIKITQNLYVIGEHRMCKLSTPIYDCPPRASAADMKSTDKRSDSGKINDMRRRTHVCVCHHLVWHQGCQESYTQ